LGLKLRDLRPSAGKTAHTLRQIRYPQLAASNRITEILIQRDSESDGDVHRKRGSLPIMTTAA